MIPKSDLDLYTDEVLLDPFPVYRHLRDQGPVVYSTHHEMYVATRYSVVREITENWEAFPSGKGVVMNDTMNAPLFGVLTSDGDEHTRLRRVLYRPLSPRSVGPLHGQISELAEEVVERLVKQGTFDAAGQLATHLPVAVVSQLVGLPEEGRERMLVWAEACFNSFGTPDKERTNSAIPVIGEALEYIATQAVPGKVKPGSWADMMYSAVDKGEITLDECRGMMTNYMIPSLDTTIYAIASGIWLFAHNPDQWDLIREDPGLIPSAINEIVRMESPIQGFSRSVARDYEIDGVVLPQDSRVIIFWGAANRDERHYPDPDRFDVRRNPVDHLGFGAGPHVCVGSNIAKMEIQAVFEALAKRVRRFEVGEYQRAIISVLRGFDKLEVTVS